MKKLYESGRRPRKTVEEGAAAAGADDPVQEEQDVQEELPGAQDPDESDDYVSAGDEGELADAAVNGDTTSGDESEGIMADFDALNEAEAKETLSRLSSVTVNWDKDDIAYWFTELENAMETINVKSQWVKRVILVNNLPNEIRTQVKDQLKLPKSQCTGDNELIYLVLKKKILKLFGKAEGENYEVAAGLLLTDKPSTLAKRQAELLCKCNPPLQCCAAETVAGLWKKQLPTQVKASIAGKSLKDDFEGTLQHADEVYASLTTTQVSAVETAETAEVAAFGARGGRARGYNNRARGGGRAGQRGQGHSRGRGRGQHHAQGGQGQPNDPATRHPDGPPENACSQHWRWGRGAWFCKDEERCPWRDQKSTPQDRR